MRTLRRQSRTEEVTVKKNIRNDEQKSIEPEIKSNHNSATTLEKNQSEIEKIKLEKELKKLREENKLLKLKNGSLKKNEEKLLAAIKSEQLNQNTKNPIISRRVLSEQYGIGRKYLDLAINGLLQKEIIKREYVNYTAKIKTSRWSICESH